MSNDLDDFFGPLLIVFALLIFGAFLYGHNEGYNIGKETTIRHCIEKPADCKLEYDYQKLQETNNDTN
jgi:hypothetical protein